MILIKRAPDKTSDLDPVSTWLVQEFAPVFAPFFAHVFNVSLEKGYLPASQKQRLFIRASRNHRYLNDNELLPSVQSAYRQFFSTETAVLKVVTDIFVALDRGQISLLDLSAVFDTVDHSILLR